MLNTETNNDHQTLFRHDYLRLGICLILMFVLAALIRLDEIKAPGHLLDREYTSAIFARAYYFMDNEEIEDWRREIAIIAKDQQPVLEPPVLDFAVSLIYRIMGREELHYARYLTIAFWLIGGIFMYLIAMKLLSIDEAVVATAYYLFVPMGVIISRSFQPDSLMMMLFLISTYLLVLYFEASSAKRLLMAAFITGITLLLRPLVIFAIFGTFIAFSIHRNQTWKKLIDKPLVIFSAVCLSPAVLYYGYGIMFAGFMRWKVSTSFMPYLLVKKDFWSGWFNNVVDVVEFMPLFLVIIGFFLVRNKQTRYLLIGLIVSFMVFTTSFTYHIHTHPYYHIQLVPIIGLCLAPVIVSLTESLKRSVDNFLWVPIAGAFLFALYIGHREVRGSLYQTRMEDPVVAYQIGEIIRHSPRTVYVSYYYGLPLEYYGEFAGAPWPVSIDDPFYRSPDARELSVQERLNGLGFTPEYFVVTNFDLFNRKHQDLQSYLTRNCSPLSVTESYLIYENCEKIAIK